jgi:hypothetical protein
MRAVPQRKAYMVALERSQLPDAVPVHGPRASLGPTRSGWTRHPARACQRDDTIPTTPAQLLLNCGAYHPQ